MFKPLFLIAICRLQRLAPLCTGKVVFLGSFWPRKYLRLLFLLNVIFLGPHLTLSACEFSSMNATNLLFFLIFLRILTSSFLMNVLGMKVRSWQWDSLGDVELTAPPLQKPCLQIWTLLWPSTHPCPLHRLHTSPQLPPFITNSKQAGSKDLPVSILHVHFLIPVIIRCFTRERLQRPPPLQSICQVLKQLPLIVPTPQD